MLEAAKAQAQRWLHGGKHARRIALVLCAGVTLLLGACEAAPDGPATAAPQTSFEVPPGQKHIVPVDLRKDDELQGTFSVSGKETYLDFYIKGPNGELVYGVVRASGNLSFRLRATAPGTHTLYFDNSFSFGSARQVSLSLAVR